MSIPQSRSARRSARADSPSAFPFSFLLARLAARPPPLVSRRNGGYHGPFFSDRPVRQDGLQVKGLHSKLRRYRAHQPRHAVLHSARRRYLSLFLLCFIALGPLSFSLPHAIWDQQVDSLHEHQAAHLPEQRSLKPEGSGEPREVDLEPPSLASLLGTLELLFAASPATPFPPSPPSIRWTVTLAADQAPRAPPRLG